MSAGDPRTPFGAAAKIGEVGDCADRADRRALVRGRPGLMGVRLKMQGSLDHGW
jgi:hypothetical protein